MNVGGCMKRSIGLAFAVAALPASAADQARMEALGKAVFFDTTLSAGANQSCAFCHDPATGFAAPDAVANTGGGVVQGSVAGLFGNRKPPTAAYAYAAPPLHHVMEEGAPLFVGGAFHDGRATGNAAGSVLADQAMGPFLNPAEMALPHAACVVARVCAQGPEEGYTVGLRDLDPLACAMPLPGTLAADCADPGAVIELNEETAAAVDASFTLIARSVAAFEASAAVSPFASRFDRWQAGQAELTGQERAGFELFRDKALCAECHVLDPGPNGEPALFTDFTYDNLGVPRNPANPWYGQAANAAGAGWVDRGLAATLEGDAVYAPFASFQEGKQKVPTLRNVDARATPDAPRAYMHNGWFKTLEGVVRFYNTRDVLPACEGDATEAEALARGCWPAPEVAANVNHDELGDLRLTRAEEAAIVAFLRTLTDETAD